MQNISNENINHICKNNIEYIQFKKLLEYPEIEHCYTIRKNDLNFRIYENDSILQQSYDKICGTLDFDRNRILKPHQTHTDKVEIVDNASQNFNEVDGVLTDKENITLCTTSADCTSLLFYDPIKKVIGDVHSGWRGTLQRIGQKAVKKMIEQYGCNPNDIICCICPHIRKCHFEVDEDVMQMFKDEFCTTFENEEGDYSNIFKPENEQVNHNNISKMDNEKNHINIFRTKVDEIIELGEKEERVQKYYIDTTLINKLMLKEVGLQESNIIDSEICTVCEREHFHSHRVDREKAGRNAAMSAIK